MNGQRERDVIPRDETADQWRDRVLATRGPMPDEVADRLRRIIHGTTRRSA